MLERDCVLPHLLARRAEREPDAIAMQDVDGPRGHVPRAPRHEPALGRRVPAASASAPVSTSSRCSRTPSKRSTRGSASRGSVRPRCPPTRCTAARCSGTSSTNSDAEVVLVSERFLPHSARCSTPLRRPGRSIASEPSSFPISPARTGCASGRAATGRRRRRRSSPARSRRPTSTAPTTGTSRRSSTRRARPGRRRASSMPWGTLWSFVTTAARRLRRARRGLLRDVPRVPRLGQGDALPGVRTSAPAW